MFFDFGAIPSQECYKLMISTITPRPIAWVVTQNAHGQLNAAPFSFFNAFAGDPPVIGIGIGSHSQGRVKDTRVNIKETGQFVVNLVSLEMAEAMNVTAIEFDAEIDEVHEAKLKTLPSMKVKPPRIAQSPVAMECELMQIVELGEKTGLVLGRILAMHVRDEAVLNAERRYIDTPNLKLVGRMHGAGWYAKTSDLFEIPRIPVAEWEQNHKG
jgi:flavin reductase (DIM6/NTAB) family NADH-FMN oxidoreductase RutF